MAKIISSPVRLSFWMCFIERTKDTTHPHENEQKEGLIAILPSSFSIVPSSSVIQSGLNHLFIYH